MRFIAGWRCARPTAKCEPIFARSGPLSYLSEQPLHRPSLRSRFCDVPCHQAEPNTSHHDLAGPWFQPENPPNCRYFALAPQDQNIRALSMLYLRLIELDAGQSRPPNSLQTYPGTRRATITHSAEKIEIQLGRLLRNDHAGGLRCLLRAYRAGSARRCGA